MKKIVNLFICIGLAACTSTHQGTKSMNVKELTFKTKPVEVSVIPGEKISGTAECKTLFGIPIQSPGREAYGAKLDTPEGNFAADRCTKGAFYNAIVSSNADVILTPQYRTTKKGILCLPWIGCAYSHDIVTVTGYKGTYLYSPPELPATVQYTVEPQYMYVPAEQITTVQPQYVYVPAEQVSAVQSQPVYTPAKQ